MKRKIEIIIEEQIVKLAKRRASQEGRSLSDLIQDALVAYLQHKLPDSKKREEAYRFFCEQPTRINREQFEEILAEDPGGI